MIPYAFGFIEPNSVEMAHGWRKSHGGQHAQRGNHAGRASADCPKGAAGFEVEEVKRAKAGWVELVSARKPA
jgi:hypothetical protein